MIFKGVVLGLSYLSLSAWGDAPTLDYSWFQQVADRRGYTWEPHQVQTEDGWWLTLLRITAVNGETYDSEKPPVFMIHGATDSG